MFYEENRKKVEIGMVRGLWLKKLSSILFKIQHKKSLTSIVVHADNLKPYRGENKVNWFYPEKENKEQVELPHLNDFQNKDSEVAPKTNFENRNSKKWKTSE